MASSPYPEPMTATMRSSEEVIITSQATAEHEVIVKDFAYENEMPRIDERSEPPNTKLEGSATDDKQPRTAEPSRAPNTKLDFPQWNWSKCPKCRNYVPAALAITPKRMTKRCQCGHNKRSPTYADLSHADLMSHGPPEYRNIMPPPLFDPPESTTVIPQYKKKPLVILRGRRVEQWLATDEEVRKKEREIYRDFYAFAISRVSGCVHKAMAKIDWSIERKYQGYLQVLDYIWADLGVISAQFREEKLEAASRDLCKSHNVDTCYCVLYEYKHDDGVVKTRWMDLRTKILNWPRAKLPWGVMRLDQLAVERNEECPECERRSCYCVAFFEGREKRLADIKRTVLQAVALGV